MFKKALLTLFSLILYCAPSLEAKPVEFVIVIPSYNNENFYQGNLDSCFNQTYPHFSVYYINDLSSDETGSLVDKYIKEHKLENKCTVVHNTERKGALRNFHEAIHKIAPHKIIVNVDGDDRLAHPQVLERIAKVYKNKKTWLTYGSFVAEPESYTRIHCKAFPKEVIRRRTFRKHKWVSSHLRTFKAGLFHKIKKEDLMFKGKFFPTAGDLAWMYPMLEMASKGHFSFINETLYIYNAQNPLNDFRDPKQTQVFFRSIIQAKKPYKPLKRLP